MFPVKCKDILPINQVVINSIAIRGGLGPITVWVTNDDDTTAMGTTASISHRHPIHAKKRSSRSSVIIPSAEKKNQTVKISLKPEDWTQIYSKTHTPSFSDYTSLDITANPIVLKPNQIRGVYIHSTLDSDEAIVYDNKHKEKTHDDTFLTVLPGRSHVSSTPFRSTWGYHGAWRDNREFVGKISYGVVYKLWNPIEYNNFGGKFRTTVRTMFACQRRMESPVSRLPDDVIYYILNMCRWDWAGDGYEACLEHKKKCRKESNEKSAAVLTDGDGGKKKSAGAAKAVSANNTSNANAKCNDDTDDSDSDSDSDMDYSYSGDHSSGNTFNFQNVDELAYPDEENTEDRCGIEGRKRRWPKNNHRYLFRQLLGGMQSQFIAGSDFDDESD